MLVQSVHISEMQLDSNKKSKSFFKSNCISAKTDSALSDVNESVSKSDKSRGFFKTAEKEETGGNAILGLLMYIRRKMFKISGVYQENIIH